MLFTRVKTAGLALLAVVLAGVALVADQPPAGANPQPAPSAPTTPAPDLPERPLELRGTVVGPDGKPVPGAPVYLIRGKVARGGVRIRSASAAAVAASRDRSEGRVPVSSHDGGALGPRRIFTGRRPRSCRRTGDHSSGGIWDRLGDDLGVRRDGHTPEGGRRS